MLHLQQQKRTPPQHLPITPNHNNAAQHKTTNKTNKTNKTNREPLPRPNAPAPPAAGVFYVPHAPDGCAATGRGAIHRAQDGYCIPAAHSISRRIPPRPVIRHGTPTTVLGLMNQTPTNRAHGNAAHTKNPPVAPRPNRHGRGGWRDHVGARYCALMGYIQGWGRKRGTMDAPHPTAQSARMGRFFMSANSLRHGFAVTPPSGREACFWSPLRGGCHEVTGGVGAQGGSEKPDGCGGHGAGAMNRAPTGRSYTVGAQFIAP